MQILPLATAGSTKSTQGGLSADALETSRHTALFASLLDSARTGGTAANTSSAINTATAAQAQDDKAAQAANQDDRMNLRLSREDLAALRDDLKERGFSDDELAALDTKAGSESGLTWGEVLKEVEKKVAATDKAAKKEISNQDTVELLGLFGKLGFTAEQSQRMVDSLAKGDGASVWAAVNEKVAGLSADAKVSLTASEMTSLGRALGLSDEAQTRLAALTNNAEAGSGLSLEGLATAFDAVKNELAAKTAEERQALAEFRQSASKVLDQAWLRESGKLNAGLHNDDVARKAGQAVAMGADKVSGEPGVPTAGKPKVNVLGDVPAKGQGVGDQAGNAAGAATETEAAAGRPAVPQAGGEKGISPELTGKAGAVAAEQAGLAGQAEQGASAKPAATGEQPHPATEKNAAVPPFGTGNQNAGNGAGQQQGGSAGGFPGQTGQDAGLAELLSKVRAEKTTGQTTAAGTSGFSQTMAATDAVFGSAAGKAAKAFDPALAARAVRQVETGILRTVGQDAKQLTLNLSPDELGKLSITLTVKDKEVKAVIAADNADTAALLTEQAAKIKQTLEDQGFKVSKLEVQTGIARDNQNAWQSPDQHNEAFEQREAMDRTRAAQRLARTLAAEESANQNGFVPPSAMTRPQGLDLFA